MPSVASAGIAGERPPRCAGMWEAAFCEPLRTKAVVPEGQVVLPTLTVRVAVTGEVPETVLFAME